MEYITHSPEETEKSGRRWESGCPLGRSLSTGGIWVRGKPPSPGDWPGGWAMGMPSPAPPIPLLTNIWAADCPCSISICTGSALPRICGTSAGRTIWTGGCLRRGVERKRSGGPGGGHDRFHREAVREYPAHHHRLGVASARSFPSRTRRAFPMEVREK